MLSPIVSGHAQLDDTRIHYEIYGSGPPVVLLHGNGESLRIFEPLLPHLQGFRLVALDTRGHGASDRGGAPLNFETLAGDVAGVLDALEIPTAHIVGYSDGGNTALHLALAAPHRVAGLVVLGANLNPGGLLPRFRIPLQLSAGFVSAVVRLDKRQASKAEQLHLMAAHPRLEPRHLRAIRTPALVAAAKRDIIRPDHTRAIAEAIAGARLEFIPGTDHFHLLRAPGTAALVSGFLRHLAPLET